MPLSHQSKIYVAGHTGMVGGAVVERLRELGYQNFTLATHKQLDLIDQAATFAWFERERPEIVIHSAALVGGIEANRNRPAEFLYDNLMMAGNVFEGARRVGVEKLLYLASSCMYPRECPQPMREEDLMTGPLEPTNEGYALAKIAGMKLGQTYSRQYGMDCVTVVPCNLYGPNDSFDPVGSHVLAALVRKFVCAKRAGDEAVTMWGTGLARREFLHASDAAAAIVTVLEKYDSREPINIGAGDDVSISELANLVCEVVGYEGAIQWDPSKPDGMPRKLVDSSLIRSLGWAPKIGLRQGIEEMVGIFEEGGHG